MSERKNKKVTSTSVAIEIVEATVDTQKARLEELITLTHASGNQAKGLEKTLKALQDAKAESEAVEVVQTEVDRLIKENTEQVQEYKQLQQEYQANQKVLEKLKSKSKEDEKNEIQSS